MAEKKKTTKQQIIDWALGGGWHWDKWGHLQKTDSTGRQYRIKLSSTAMRYEVKVTHGRGDSEWMRLRSGYYKDISIHPTNKLAGLK